jgi:hypothetical protein
LGAERGPVTVFDKAVALLLDSLILRPSPVLLTHSRAPFAERTTGEDRWLASAIVRPLLVRALSRMARLVEATMTRRHLIAALLAILTALGVSFIITGGYIPTPGPTFAPTAGNSAGNSASATVSASPASAAPSPENSAGNSASAAACATTDQVQFIYRPSRLKVLAPCVRAEGTIAAMRKEADGDFHILLKLDPAFAHLVNAANSGLELGDLVVEPVCELVVTQTDAQAICATDKDPISLVGLKVGEHVWMEGRWVEDLEHGSWRELHPLYSWVGN